MAAIDLLYALRRRVSAMESPASRRVASARTAALTPWLVGLGGVLCAMSVVVAASGASSDAAFGRGLLQLLIVGVPIGVGIYALRTSSSARFGLALLVIGFTWSLTAWAESSSSLAHSIGRLATWVIFPCVVYLLLAFPSGRVHAGLDRAVLLGVTGVMVVLFFGTAPLVQAFPTKTLWSTCVSDCPENAFFVLDSQPAFLTNLILVREWLVELLWLGLFASMFRRWRAASALQRRTMGPAFVAGAALGVCHYLHITSRQLEAPTDLVVAFSSAWTFCIVVVCTAFLVGLVWHRTLMANALARLGVALRISSDPARVEEALGVALSDPTTRLTVRDPESDAWHDAQRRPVEWPPTLGPGQALTTISAEDGVHEAAVLHNAALRDDPELLEGVSGAVLTAWRQERLVNELAGAVAGLEDLQGRIADVGHLERARLERDLHDGAQQRLIALQIRLTLAEEQVRSDPDAAAEDIRALGAEVELAIDELRSLATGASPSVLTNRGLPDALRALAAQTPTSISVTADQVTRHPIDIESAVYFTCSEAVQNALKHAAGAASIRIVLSQSAEALRFEVRDDGPGIAPDASEGRGLRNMRERMSAVGGVLVVDSQPGRGTSVLGSVMLGAAP
jgi:signal transduction histidine kinase